MSTKDYRIRLNLENIKLNIFAISFVNTLVVGVRVANA